MKLHPSPSLSQTSVTDTRPKSYLTLAGSGVRCGCHPASQSKRFKYLDYDAAGNRKAMTDGLGYVQYAYNNLSQMTSETRSFNGLAAYTLSYSYNLAGELSSMTNPWSGMNYGYDKAGRITGVTGGLSLNAPQYATGLSYRAFGAIKGMNYGDGTSLSTTFDKRLRPTKWDVSGVLGYNYNYDYLNEHTGRVTYAGSIYDATLDRSYEYDNVGRLAISHSGAEARAHVGVPGAQWGTMDGPYSQGYDYDVWGNVTHKYGWGGEVQGGTAGQTSDIYYNYTNNQRNGFSYDAAGNLTNDIGQQFTYDATGQQTASTYTNLQNWYDGDGLRVKKSDTSTLAYYLRSTVLGGQVVAEMSSNGARTREYLYLGGQLLVVRSPSKTGVKNYWVHEDPITKSKRVTNNLGAVVSTIEMDPWGADTTRSNNAAFQPKKFTSYERDANGSDEAMFRRSNRWHSRFDQPDPSNGSYDFNDPQSFNRYAYVSNDPVNFVDPTGLLESWNGFCGAMYNNCFGAGGGVSYTTFNDGWGRGGCDEYGGYHLSFGGVEYGYWPDGGGFCSGRAFHPTEGGRGGSGREFNHPQDPSRPKKIPTVVVVAKKDEYAACVWRQWRTFNENVEKVKQAARQAADKLRLHWTLFQSIVTLFREETYKLDPPFGGDGIADAVVDGATESAIAKGEEEDIQKGTQKAAEDRDKAIDKNCNPLKT